MTERAVIDTSYALSLVMSDESVPSSASEALSARLMAPAIWSLEIANALLSNVRRKRLTESQASDVLAAIERLDVDIVASPSLPPRYVYTVAVRYALTPYDAQFLELANRQGCALATCDSAMALAARRIGVATFA